MKTTLACSLLAMSLAACSDEADIGVDSEPITCQRTAIGDMGGSVEYNGKTYTFENGAPTITRDTQTGFINGLSLWSSENPDTQIGNYMRFYFQCGQDVEATSYGVVDGRSQQVTCPHEVSGAVLGAIEVLPATDGVLTVDETTSCFAGRFRVDLESDLGGGSVGGWFSVPLQ